MFRRLAFLVIAFVGVLPASSQAALISWESHGLVTWLTDLSGIPPSQPKQLADLTVGTPWSLTFILDTDTPAIPLLFGGTDSYQYKGAITQTTFTLGQWVYTNSNDDVFTNTSLPWDIRPTPLGSPGGSGPGLVQFQWAGGWVGSAGAPNLNYGGFGLMTASYNDVNVAVDGSRLPMSPQAAAQQGALSDLTYWGDLGCRTACVQFDSPPIAFTVTPEPGTLSLLAFGAAAGGWRVRRRRMASLRSL